MKKTDTIIIILFMIISLSTNLTFSTDNVPYDNHKIPENTVSPEQPTIIDLGNGRTQLGNIIIDGKRKEVIVPGRVNMKEGVIEFIACTKGGYKAYESALEMDTDAKTFNLSMILLGLDPKKGKAAAYHFDPNPPQGDSIEITIQWNTEKEKKAIMAQELIHDMNTGKVFPAGHWVYTGSVFLDDGIYLAEEAGVLIGFIHDPAPVIESPLSAGTAAFGSFVVNSDIVPEVGTKIQMIIKPFNKKNN